MKIKALFDQIFKTFIGQCLNEYFWLLMNSFSKKSIQYSVNILIDLIQIRPNSSGQTEYCSFLARMVWLSLHCPVEKISWEIQICQKIFCGTSGRRYIGHFHTFSIQSILLLIWFELDQIVQDRPNIAFT